MFRRRKKPGKSFPVIVITMDQEEMEFNLEWKATGRDLLELVCRTIGLRETWFFGLQYVSSYNLLSWIRMDKKIQSQDIPHEYPVKFYFLAQFYPENVNEELVQEVTQHLFFLQVKQQIVGMDIYCPPEVAVLLASYALQAKYGDIDEARYKPGMLIKEELLPPRVLEQYQMTPEMWEEKIRVWYQDHRGKPRDVVEMEYLKIAQDLDMYGINYYHITNKKGTELWLGVTAQGLKIFEKENKLAPKTMFPWSEIRNISFDDKKFIIKLVDKNSPPFSFYSRNLRVNKTILELCIGNHNLFMRRRRPDSMEVQHMKARAKEESLRRQMERSKLAREKQLREELEMERSQLEHRLMQYQEEARLANEALHRSEEAAELLAEKSRLAEEEARLLSEKATKAEEEVRRLGSLYQKGQEERQLLSQKMRDAELLAAQCMEESELRAEEARRLQDELRRARMAEKEAKERLFEVLKNTYVNGSTVVMNSSYDSGASVPHAHSPAGMVPPSSSLAPPPRSPRSALLDSPLEHHSSAHDRSGSSAGAPASEIDRLVMGYAEQNGTSSLRQALARSGAGDDSDDEVEDLVVDEAPGAPSPRRSILLPPSTSPPSSAAPPPYHLVATSSTSATTYTMSDIGRGEMVRGEERPEEDFNVDSLFVNGEMERLSLEIEKEREEYLQKSQSLRCQLSELKSEIDQLKVEENQTDLDEFHGQLAMQGEDKYSTINKIKQGSTKSRVAFFEEL
ncbi:unnamed protein product [Cyprideis torosa]|uniref:Moesin/ezrin/radixin homolog 1 n=1 Tax=Cyprideis torosa TaxID=163714 RepID=A0A7R8ZMZ1_9CRUS|nr:unnamed protein product [Cyprideis torosa]CAG0896743.1 unnamed protein product [Cyprideis torosa]